MTFVSNSSFKNAGMMNFKHVNSNLKNHYIDNLRSIHLDESFCFLLTVSEVI